MFQIIVQFAVRHCSTMYRSSSFNRNGIDSCQLVSHWDVIDVVVGTNQMYFKNTSNIQNVQDVRFKSKIEFVNLGYIVPSTHTNCKYDNFNLFDLDLYKLYTIFKTMFQYGANF